MYGLGVVLTKKLKEVVLMTMNTETTPPNMISALFPFEPNKHLVDDVAAAGYRLFAYPEKGYLLFEGDTTTVAHAMAVFTGGTRAH